MMRIIFYASLFWLFATKELFQCQTVFNVCSHNTECLTLEDYVENMSYTAVSSNTIFVFSGGKHYLTSLLVLRTVSNVTFQGSSTGLSVIIAEATISIAESTNIKFQSLKIFFEGLSGNVLLVENTQSFQLLDIIINVMNNWKSMAHTITLIFSTASLINSSFYNGFSLEGGAVYIRSSNVTFYGISTFMNNTALYSGGAIYAENSDLLFSGTSHFSKNKVNVITRTPFNGGGAIFGHNSIIKLNGTSNFIENESVFRGAAIALDNSEIYLSGYIRFFKNLGSYSGGALLCVQSQCMFRGKINFTSNNAGDGGAIFASNSLLLVSEDVLFLNNSATSSGGGVQLQENSILSVSGKINYSSNVATLGGGMSITAPAKLELVNPSSIMFSNNKATYGGAILYTYSELYTQLCQDTEVNIGSCFFEILNQNRTSDTYRNIHINFTNNTASAGSDVFGGALDLCRVLIDRVQRNPSGKQILQAISTFNTEDNSSISSYPLQVCFCLSEKSDCSANAREVSIPHGRTFNISVVAVGQLDSPVPGQIGHSTKIGLVSEFRRRNFDNIRTPRSCYNISYQILSLNSYELFYIYPIGCSSQAASRKIIVNFEVCPPGFRLAVDECVCEEHLMKIDRNIICNIQTGLIKKPRNVWIQPLQDINNSYLGFMWTPSCPRKFCKTGNVSNPIWLNFSSSATNSQCLENRTGTICSACKRNYSLTLNKLSCQICSNSYIGLIVLFAIAGMGLIAVLLILNITVASGTTHGIILYVNVINISLSIYFPPGQHRVNPLTLFVSWLNLDFGISSCLFDGLSFFSYTWLQFLFPFYLWSLVGLIVVASKASFRVGRIFGSNPVAILATVILMSYTKLLHTSMEALSYTVIKYSDGTEKKFWKGDPNLPYFEGKHIPLALFALFVLTFLVVPYVLLLLFGYQIQAYSNKRGFQWFNRLKPFLDAYYAPYKKNARYWIGLLLIVRTGLYTTQTLTETNTCSAVLIVTSAIFATVAILPWLGIHIYEKSWLDILEASFILNISILAITTYHLQVINGNQLILSFFSIGIAFVEFVVILVYHVLVHVKKKRANFNRNIVTQLYKKYFLPKLCVLNKNLEVEEDNQNATTELNITTVDIREPLLEDEFNVL